MNASDRRGWVGTAVLVGVVYLVVGLIFAALAGRAGGATMRTAWRLAAWLASAIAFAAHVRHEQTRMGRSPGRTAAHAAAAAAIGAFLLAVAAIVHSSGMVTSAGHQRLLRLSLVLWPAITAIPAFVVALVLATMLAWLRQRAGAANGSPSASIDIH